MEKFKFKVDQMVCFNSNDDASVYIIVEIVDKFNVYIIDSKTLRPKRQMWDMSLMTLATPNQISNYNND